MIKCKCGWQVHATKKVLMLNCKRCGELLIWPDDEYLQRERYCRDCKWKVPKGCAQYLKPCTVKQLWADQIEAPEKCPQKERFEA